MFFQFKMVRLDLEKWKGRQALLGLSGLSFLLGSSNTALNRHKRQVSETPNSKTDSFRTLMVLLKGVSVHESLCTKKNFQSFSRCKNAAQNKLAFVSKVQGGFCNSTYFFIYK